MAYYVTVLLAGKNAELNSFAFEKTDNFFKNHRIIPSDRTYLHPTLAAECFFESSEDAMVLQTHLKAALQDLPFDCAVLPAHNRKKQLLIADMDSTIITVECIDELADYAGIKDKVSEITEKAMRGELDFEQALTERVALLKGLPLSVLQECYKNKITFTEGAKTLVQTMKASGAYCALVSGGFTFFTQKVAWHCGFHIQRANTLCDNGTALTGRVEEPILGKQAKLGSLIEFAAARNLDMDKTMAVGDGANDLAMIEKAGLGVAFHAKPAVAAAARVSINHADLTGLLYLQGYRHNEFKEVIWTKCP